MGRFKSKLVPTDNTFGKIKIVIAFPAGINWAGLFALEDRYRFYLTWMQM